MFSEWAFDWTRPSNLVQSIRYALGIRQKYAELLSNPDPDTMFVGYSDNPHLVVFARQDDDDTVVLLAAPALKRAKGAWHSCRSLSAT